MTASGVPQVSLAALFARALTLHHQGDLTASERLCDEVLSRQPRHFDALHLRGFIALQSQRLDEGITLVTRAIAVNPNLAQAHRTLAVGLRKAKRTDQALASVDRALELRPNYAEAHYERGLILAYLLRTTEALACHERAITIKSDYYAAYVERGILLQRLKRHSAAVDSYGKAISLRPNVPVPHFNRGTALAEVQRYGEALICYERAIALQPDFAHAYINRGDMLEKLQRRDDALTSYDQAIALDGHLTEAHYNRAALLATMNRHEEALAGYDTVIALKPDYAAAHWNKSLSLLALGRFSEGWAQYEWRKRTARPVANRPFPRPAWLGHESIVGKTLMIHAEQGLGDTLQFCRYGVRVNELGAKVIMAVQPELVRLLKCLEPEVSVIAETTAGLPSFDVHCPMMSLPLALGTRSDSIPTSPRYLRPPSGLRAAWDARLAEYPGLKVGLVWAGSMRPHQPELAVIDAHRSIALTAYAPLATVPGVTFVSLQKGPPSMQAHTPPAGMILHDWTDDLTDFADTAALIDALDLVISVDTAVAHLTGALGKPIWLLNRFDTCWRWLLNRSDSPWYPSLRLFRQPALGEWASVTANVARALQHLVERGTRT